MQQIVANLPVQTADTLGYHSSKEYYPNHCCEHQASYILSAIYCSAEEINCAISENTTEFRGISEKILSMHASS